MCEIFDKISHRRRATSSDGFRIFPQNKEALIVKNKLAVSLLKIDDAVDVSSIFKRRMIDGKEVSS
ncbi:hypothetical protein ABK01_05785 [Treponema sp. OMZ 305]|nr:hypothetical protein ABK01_05785 [Treponema sp. OMZ 305]